MALSGRAGRNHPTYGRPSANPGNLEAARKELSSGNGSGAIDERPGGFSSHGTNSDSTSPPDDD